MCFYLIIEQKKYIANCLSHEIKLNPMKSKVFDHILEKYFRFHRNKKEKANSGYYGHILLVIIVKIQSYTESNNS